MASILAAWGRVRRVLYAVPTGCHAAGQRVLMFDGSLRAAEDVQVGDALMGPDSGPRFVLQLCRGRGPMYRIVPVKGVPFVVNDEHVLTLVRTNDSRGRGGELVDVSVREWLAWGPTQKHVHKLVRTGVDFLSRDALPIDPYFLGVLLGDGSMIRNVSVCKPDAEIREEVYSQATACGLTVRIDGAGTSASLHMTGRGRAHPMRAHLEGLGLYGCDSGAKFIPAAYKTASREARLALLAGLIDTDGHYSHGFDWISKSERLANDLVFVARSLGLAAYVKRCRKGCQTGAIGTYYRVSISGDLSVVPCRIPRKQAAARQQVKNVLRTGFRVEPVGEDEFYGWTLNGDGRYLLDDFTITHNSGKTVVAAALILRCVAQGANVLFLAHRRELIKQAFCKLVRAGISPESIGIVLAGVPLPQGALFVDDTLLDDDELWRRHARRRPGAAVQIASVDTLRHRAAWPLADRVFVDECHRALAKTYVAIAEHYGAARILGLTATPVRTDGRGLGEAFDELVQGPSYVELVEAGALVAPRVFTVPAASRPDLSSVKVVAGDYNAGELERACDRAGLVGDIVDHWLRRGNGAPTFAFATSVAHSRHIVERFVAAGVRAAHLDGSTPTEERDGVLEDLRAGRVSVVSNCDVCTEGTDVPAVKTIVLARPTKSVRIYLQQVGRGSRPAPGSFVILDHAGSVLDHGLPQQPREWSLEGRKRRGKSASAPVKSCEQCYAVVPISCTSCPECGWEFPDAPKREAQEEMPGELVEVRALTTDELSEAWDSLVEEWEEGNHRRDVPRKPGWIWYRFQERFHQPPPAGCKLPSLSADLAARRARADELARLADERGYAPGFVHARMAAEVRQPRAVGEEWSW